MKIDDNTNGQRTPAVNNTFTIGGVTCFCDTFEVNGSVVLRMNFCAEEPAHPNSANVIGHAMPTGIIVNDRQEMNRTAISDKPCLTSFAEAKEKQCNPQANAKLLRICFCPTERITIELALIYR